MAATVTSSRCVWRRAAPPLQTRHVLSSGWVQRTLARPSIGAQAGSCRGQELHRQSGSLRRMATSFQASTHAREGDAPRSLGALQARGPAASPRDRASRSADPARSAASTAAPTGPAGPAPPGRWPPAARRRTASRWRQQADRPHPVLDREVRRRGHPQRLSGARIPPSPSSSAACATTRLRPATNSRPVQHPTSAASDLLRHALQAPAGGLRRWDRPAGRARRGMRPGAHRADTPRRVGRVADAPGAAPG